MIQHYGLEMLEIAGERLMILLIHGKGNYFLIYEIKIELDIIYCIFIYLFVYLFTVAHMMGKKILAWLQLPTKMTSGHHMQDLADGMVLFSELVSSPIVWISLDQSVDCFRFRVLINSDQYTCPIWTVRSETDGLDVVGTVQWNLYYWSGAEL